MSQQNYALSICYAISLLDEGTGQTARLLQLMSYSSKKVNSTVIAPTIRLFTNALPDLARIHKSKTYYFAFLDHSVIESMRQSDVVVVNSGIPYFIAAIISRRPIVYILQQPDPVFIFLGKERLNRLLARIIERPFLLRKATVLVSISPWIKTWFLNRFGLDSIVIAESFDLSIFKRSESTIRREIDSAGPHLLCVGGWDGYQGRKRTHELIELLPESKIVFPNVRLSLVGLSDRAKYELGQLAIRLNVMNDVRLVGKLETEELVKEYNAADVFVTATLVEGFYRPLLEAFACGIPGVVRDASDSIDAVSQATVHHINNSGGGALYDSSARSYINAIRTVLENYETMSTNAITYAKTFDNTILMPKYFEIFNNLSHISPKRRSR